MRIVFMGTPDLAATVLGALLASRHEIVGVCCQPDKIRGRNHLPTPPPVKERALACDIPIYQPRSLRQKAHDRLSSMAPDLMVVAAYGRILPQSILDIPRYGCLNVHASLLPRYRGAAPIQWAIANGDAQSGVTIMQMDAGLDTGHMLASSAVPITATTTADQLHDTLARVGSDLLLETLDDLEAGRLRPVAQDDSLATCAPMLTRSDGELSWQRTGAAIDCRVRGFHPWPGAHTWLAGRQLKVFPPVHPRPGPSQDTPPGTILAIGKDGLLVQCGDGALLLTDVQLQGKKRMAAYQFATGARLETGTLLGQP
jgi:methionyl-tRNA formyltransferase